MDVLLRILPPWMYLLIYHGGTSMPIIYTYDDNARFKMAWGAGLSEALAPEK
jgi:hypothetical protein